VECESNNRGLFERTIFEIYGIETLGLQFVPESDTENGNTVASVHKYVD
jgi:hypothetical protein